jgi:hypothetical protein
LKAFVSQENPTIRTDILNDRGKRCDRLLGYVAIPQLALDDPKKLDTDAGPPHDHVDVVPSARTFESDVRLGHQA